MQYCTEAEADACVSVSVSVSTEGRLATLPTALLHYYWKIAEISARKTATTTQTGNATPPTLTQKSHGRQDIVRTSLSLSSHTVYMYT